MYQLAQQLLWQLEVQKTLKHVQLFDKPLTNDLDEILHPFPNTSPLTFNIFVSECLMYCMI